MKKFAKLLIFLTASLGAFSSYANTEEPLFKDGKGFYSYTHPLNVELPKDGKVLIQYFYRYGCKVCLNADDYLKAYAERNSDKVVLQRNVGFYKGNAFSAKMDAAFQLIGKPELSDLFLFDSADQKDEVSLVKQDKVITAWLKRHRIDPKEFETVFKSDEAKQKMEENLALYRKYMPPRDPIAIINGKYILIQNTLYNDDYTFAVLDFLVNKLQNEQKTEKEQNKWK